MHWHAVTNQSIIPKSRSGRHWTNPQMWSRRSAAHFFGCSMGMLRLPCIVFPHPVDQFSAFWILLATFSWSRERVVRRGTSKSEPSCSRQSRLRRGWFGPQRAIAAMLSYFNRICWILRDYEKNIALWDHDLVSSTALWSVSVLDLRGGEEGDVGCVWSMNHQVKLLAKIFDTNLSKVD